MYAPTRWLLEIYPIDEILASELKIDLKNIHFEMAPIGSPAYEVVATAKNGGQLFRRTFDPVFVDRPFFDRFPDYEHVRVTTGWLKATVAGKPAVDERIATDPGAILGSLPVEDPARAVRPRDETQQRQAAARGRAVLR